MTRAGALYLLKIIYDNGSSLEAPIRLTGSKTPDDIAKAQKQEQGVKEVFLLKISKELPARYPTTTWRPLPK